MRPQTISNDHPALLPCSHEAEIAAARDEIAAAKAKIENLETALTTARVIGCAVGIVMATYKLPKDEAFNILVMVSQNRHLKLRDIAEDVNLTGTLNWGSL